MNSFDVGRRAERSVADHLISRGYAIISKNWRTKWCEVDIIAAHDRVIYFIEVKYRSSAVAGSGLDYITLPKLRQMARAAETWTQQHNWEGEYSLAAAEVYGSLFKVVEFVVLG